MFEKVDLAPAARWMAAVVDGVRDDQLKAPAPCEESSLGDLVEHVDGLSRAFAAAATKEQSALTSTPPAPDAARLGADWRTRVPPQLDALAAAWVDPAAWDGTTQVGGVTLPGAVAGRIALNELVLHGWDIARASGQPFEPEPETLRACLESISAMYPPDDLDRFGLLEVQRDGAAASQHKLETAIDGKTTVRRHDAVDTDHLGAHIGK